MRPNRAPDFVFDTNRRWKHKVEPITNSMYWKEMIAIVKCGIEEYQYDIVVTEFGRIDMRLDDICDCISWVKGLKESYELFVMEEALLHD